MHSYSISFFYLTGNLFHKKYTLFFDKSLYIFDNFSCILKNLLCFFFAPLFRPFSAIAGRISFVRNLLFPLAKQRHIHYNRRVLILHLNT